MNTHLKTNNAFTLMEIIIAITILGVLAGLALPRFTFSIEKMRSAEAIQILDSLRSAQKAYQFEHTSFTANLTDLDITIPTSKSFSAPTLKTSDPIASIKRNDPGGKYDYTFSIKDEGSITCIDNTSPAGTCARLGFP